MRGQYSPIDPVAYGSPIPCPGNTTGVLSAVVGNNADLIEQVARLWIAPNDRVIDVTYGQGVFWRNRPDIAVTGTDLGTDGVDCRALPYPDGSVDVVVFDPPYQPLHGKPDREFGVGRSYQLGVAGLRTITGVLDLYQAGLKEASRVLADKGRVLVKCQDLTYNHRLHLVHLDVIRRMVEARLDLADMFVLVNQTRMPQPTKRQQRAHRSHSYLLIGVRA